MSKRRREAKFQNEIDLNKVYCEKKPVKGLLHGCLSSVSGGIHFRQRSVVGVLCSSLLLSGASGIMPGKTTTVVYAADIEKYTDAEHALVRFCTSWATTEEQVNELLVDVAAL